MNENKLMQQVTAILSVFMVLFYLGVGCYLLFYFQLSYLNKALRSIMGFTFLMYGVYRAFRAYVVFKELFFNKNNNKE